MSDIKRLRGAGVPARKAAGAGEAKQAKQQTGPAPAKGWAAKADRALMKQYQAAMQKYQERVGASAVGAAANARRNETVTPQELATLQGALKKLQQK